MIISSSMKILCIKISFTKCSFNLERGLVGTYCANNYDSIESNCNAATHIQDKSRNFDYFVEKVPFTTKVTNRKLNSESKHDKNCEKGYKYYKDLQIVTKLDSLYQDNKNNNKRLFYNSGRIYDYDQTSRGSLPYTTKHHIIPQLHNERALAIPTKKACCASKDHDYNSCNTAKTVPKKKFIMFMPFTKGSFADKGIIIICNQSCILCQLDLQNKEVVFDLNKQKEKKNIEFGIFRFISANQNFNDYKKLNLLKDCMRTLNSEHCLFTHYAEILNEVQENLIEILPASNKSFRSDLKVNITRYINSYIKIYNHFDLNIIRNVSITVQNISQYVENDVISYKDYIIPFTCKVLDKVIEEDKKFYTKLKQYVKIYFFTKEFTFNNLYVLICQNVYKLQSKIYIIEYQKNLIAEILRLLRQSSKASLFYFFEIAKIIKYLECNEPPAFSCLIDDLNVYFGILNVLSVVLKFHWNKYVNNISIKPNKSTESEDIQKITINEKHRQNFYKILLFTIRPLVRSEKYMEVWCKIIIQDLVVTYHLAESTDDDKLSNSLSKLICFQLFEIFTFEQNNYLNVLFFKNSEKFSVMETLKHLLCHHHFTNLARKIGQISFRKKLVMSITCILDIVYRDNAITTLNLHFKENFEILLEEIKKHNTILKDFSCLNIIRVEDLQEPMVTIIGCDVKTFLQRHFYYVKQLYLVLINRFKRFNIIP